MQIRYSTRIVFLIGNRAYKIPLSRRGWLQGKNEAKVWERYKSTNMLAPLIWERWGIVCQERCSPVLAFNSSRKQKVRLIKSLIPQLNIENCDLNNPQNWGKWRNRIVLVDYGIDEKIADMY